MLVLCMGSVGSRAATDESPCGLQACHYRCHNTWAWALRWVYYYYLVVLERYLVILYLFAEACHRATCAAFVGIRTFPRRHRLMYSIEIWSGTRHVSSVFRDRKKEATTQLLAMAINRNTVPPVHTEDFSVQYNPIIRTMLSELMAGYPPSAACA